MYLFLGLKSLEKLGFECGMTLIKDFIAWWKAMDTLPWTIKAWAIAFPLPQVLGGLFFIQTVPGCVILLGRGLSAIIATQVHKRAYLSKMMGPVGHAHWVLILPYLIYVLKSQALPTPLFYFILYVVVTSLISAVIDIFEVRAFLKNGHVEYKG